MHREKTFRRFSTGCHLIAYKLSYDIDFMNAVQIIIKKLKIVTYSTL